VSLNVVVGSAQVRGVVVVRSVMGLPDDEAPVAYRDCNGNHMSAAISSRFVSHRQQLAI